MTAAEVESADPFVLARTLESLSPRDIDALSERDAEAVVVACERITTAVQARQSAAMHALAARVEERLATAAETPAAADSEAPEPAAPGPDPHGVVASMLAPALRCSTRTVHRRLVSDRWLVCAMESTFSAFWAGDLGRHRADAVVEAGMDIDPDLRTRYEALVLETSVDHVSGELTLVSDRVRMMTRSQLARRAAKIARALDPESHARAAQRAREQRTVSVVPDRRRPGMALWKAHLPSDVSQRVFAAVDGLASQYARANADTPIDAHRADALADLVLGNAEVQTVVELLVPVLPATSPAPVTLGEGDLPSAFAQLRPVVTRIAEARAPGAELVEAGETGHGTAGHGTAGHAAAGHGTAGHGAAGHGAAGHRAATSSVTWILPGPVEDPRHGAVVPEAVAELLSRPETVIRLARLDPDASIVQDPASYRPSASVRRKVRARDGICRFPGCHTPARRTDLDHVVAHPGGPTAPDNLVCLCRTHHLFKHHGGWHMELARDGTVRWAAPDGRVWLTQPAPHGVHEDLHLTEHVSPATVHDLDRGWFPGLPPGMSLAELIQAELLVPEDAPEPAVTPPPPADWQDLDPSPGCSVIVGRGALSPLERHLAKGLALALAA